MDLAEPDAEEIDASKTEHDRDARPWLTLIKEAEKEFESYQQRADKIDREYADLDRLAGGDDDEFNLLWANLEVIRPSIYAREPVPVVMPRFRDRKPLPRKAAELLERALISDIETDDLHGTLLMVRDDLAAQARGVPWLSVQEVNEMPRAVAEHVCRRDFICDPARKWTECEWVARRVHLSRKRMRERFGDIGLKAQFKEKDRSDEENDDAPRRRRTAEVWEIWHKTDQVVVWVTEGVTKVLDIRDPFLTLEGFFPCPKPAFGTLKRDSLIPVPDILYYRGQINRVNELTARIAALTQALKVRGLYPAGIGDVGEAIEHALELDDDRQIVIGVPNLAQFATGSGGRLIEWLPIDQVILALREAVEVRRQLIEDIYQLTGISDIMRGETEAEETLGAQNLKAQYGSVRIRNRQEEMVRVARDVIRMKAEIMAEQFDGQTLLAMSQIDDLPTAEQLQQAQAIVAQAQQFQAAAQQDPQMAQQAQGHPQFAQMAQAAAQAQELIDKCEGVTIDAVMALLQEQRLRPFVLEIETDSTIQPNEDAEKQRRTEFLAAVGGMAQQALPMVQQFPETGAIVVEMLRFAAGGFRAGRDIEGELDNFGQQVRELSQQMASQRGQPTPEQLKMAAETKKIEAETAKIAAEAQQGPGANDNRGEMAAKQAELQLKAREAAAKQRLSADEAAADAELRREELQLNRDIRRAELQLKQMELEAKTAMADRDREAKMDMADADREARRSEASAAE